MRAIDVFSGAGGMSLGAIMAGIDIAIAIENNQSAALTFKKNHPNTKVICEDIRNVGVQDLEYPFVIFGGPPCQGFSTSNTKTRTSDNSNNSLFYEFIRLVNELKPKWFVFENVEGITSFEKGMVIEKLKKTFTELGYNVTYDVLFASDYGVPQNRNRFFMVGNRLGIDFFFPEKQKGKVSVYKAIHDLPVLKNGDLLSELPYKKGKPSRYASLLREGCNKSMQNFVSKNKEYVIARYKYVEQGGNWKSIPSNLMRNYTNSKNCHSGIYKRLDPKKPSVVIANYRKNMLIHPFEDRGLSVREAARIQSFPDNFLFEGSLSHIQQQIGNAVPPLLAKAIFQQIINLTPMNERN